MKWTDVQPSKPGYYFMKRMDIKGEPYGIAQVRAFPFGDGEVYIEVYVGDHWQSLNGFARYVQCQWSDAPVPEPEGE